MSKSRSSEPVLSWLRTTHDKGVPKEFSDAAKQVWSREVGFIGHCLHPRKWMTLDEVVAADLDYAKTFQEEPTDRFRIAHALDVLCRHGFAAVRES